MSDDLERIQYLQMVDYVHEWTEWLKHDEVEVIVYFDDAVVQVIVGGIEAMYEDVMSPKWSKIFHTHRPDGTREFHEDGT